MLCCAQVCSEEILCCDSQIGVILMSVLQEAFADASVCAAPVAPVATPVAPVAASPATPGAPIGATATTAATTTTPSITLVTPPATPGQAGAVAAGPDNAAPSGGWKTAAAKVSYQAEAHVALLCCPMNVDSVCASLLFALTAITW